MSVENERRACPGCGAYPRGGDRFCGNCGKATDPRQAVCLSCGALLTRLEGGKSRIAAALLAIFLGPLGIHKFYLGRTAAGLTMLAVTLFGSAVTFGFAASVMMVLGVVEGIVYLTKTDMEFYQVYVIGRKSWF